MKNSHNHPLSQNGKKEFVYSGFRLFENGLEPVGSPTFAEWVSCGHFLKETETAVQFWIGEWLLFGEKTYGKVQYEQAIRETGLDYSTLRDYKWVASSVPMPLRSQKLGFHHHRAVASLPVEAQARLLTQAEQEQWPLIKLKQETYRARAAPLPSLQASHPDFLHGDCTQLLETLPDESLDLLLTDPPYGIEYVSRLTKLDPSWKIANDTLKETLLVVDKALAIAARKLKNNTHVYVFTRWDMYPILVPIIERYFSVSNLLVWVKNNWTAGDLMSNYGQMHELIVFAQKGSRALTNPQEASDLLRFARVGENGRLHPTEKPLPLLEYLIEQSSRPGEVVCDPFAGAASTLVAAQNTARRFIGMELDATWHSQGLSRLQAKASDSPVIVDGSLSS